MTSNVENVSDVSEKEVLFTNGRQLKETQSHCAVVYKKYTGSRESLEVLRVAVRLETGIMSILLKYF